MAQIPVSNGKQILEPGSPVQIAGSESVAGAMEGNAIEALGKAMTFLGDQAKKVKDVNDKYRVKAIADDAYLMMLQRKAEIDARGIGVDDRDDGFTAVELFATNVDNDMSPFLDERLGADSALRPQVEAMIKEDRSRLATQVLAGEVNKREKYLPIQRQARENTAAAKVRADAGQFDLVRQGLNTELAQDPSISGAMFAETIQKANKTLARESISGFLDKVNNGDLDAAPKAREFLTKKLNGFFTSEEMTKEMDRIDDTEFKYINRQYTNYQRQKVEAEYRSDKLQEIAKTEIFAQVATLGNSESEMQAVHNKIDTDFRFKDEGLKSALHKAVTTRSLPGDNAVENEFLRRVVNQKQNTQTLSKFLDDKFKSQNLSMSKYNDLLGILKNMNDETKVPAHVKMLMSQVEAELRTYGMDTQDPADSRYSGQYQRAQQGASNFVEALTRIVQRGDTLTVDMVIATRQFVIQNFFKTDRSLYQPIQGIPNSMLQNSENINKVSKDLAKDIIRKLPGATPEQKKIHQQQLKDLGNRLQKVEELENYKLQPKPNSGRARPFDE